MARKLILFLTPLVFLFSCSNNELPEEAPSDSPKEVSFSTWGNEGEPAYEGMLKFIEVIEENTDYEVSLFPGTQLGSTAEQMEQVMMGSNEMMFNGGPVYNEIQL